MKIIQALAILLAFSILPGCAQQNQETIEKKTVFEYNQEKIKDVRSKH